MNDFENALDIIQKILPAADSWMDMPADTYAVLEHIGTDYFYEDNEIGEALIRAQLTIWSKQGQQTLENFMRQCSEALKKAGWCLGAIQAANEVINGISWHGQARALNFLNESE